ncbi:hypothetical protein JCM8097_007890 [Rhodosporidiobolus ruineniae]
MESLSGSSPLNALAPFLPALSHSSRFHLPDHLAPHCTQQRTRQPDHCLFIDHLLTLALPPDAAAPAYPPQSHPDLDTLVHLLTANPPNPLTARSALFYLLLDYSTPQLALAFAKDHLLPAPFRQSVMAFHALDHQDYRRGVKLLADPRVKPDFVPRTLAILDSLPAPDERAQLVLSYWRLAGINLADHGKDEVKVVICALCGSARKAGANEAWELAREWHVEQEREELARAVLETCFGANTTGRPLAQHLSTLLTRPFTAAEDALSQRFCASPPSSINPTLAADWLLSKLIAESRPVDALRFWTTVKRNNQHSKRVEMTEQRERLLAAVEANLTPVQKATLSLDVGGAPSSSAAAVAGLSKPPAPSSNKLTQPAWALPPPPSAPAAPAQPPKTLTAARLAQLPPPAAPAPTAADLPLSASPFLASSGAGGSGAGGVLRALEVSQQTPKKGAQQAGVATSQGGFVASPAAAARLGSAPAPGSPFAFPPPSVSAASAASSASPAKPTLSGFGSVRQVQQPSAQATPRAPSRRVQEIEMGSPERGEEQDAEEEEEEDDEMMVDSPAAPAPGPAPAKKEKQQEKKASPPPPAAKEEPQQEQDDDFAARAARDPAIAATIAAAESPSSRQPAPSSSSSASQSKPAPSAAKRATRTSRTSGRGDKRRAVSVEPHEAASSRARRTAGRERPDEGRTVKLPPGAFPGQSEDEAEHELEVEPVQKGKSGKTPAARPTRRSTRQATVEPASSEVDEPQQQQQQGRRAVRRSTRASSAAPGAAGDDSPPAKTSTRRSSRLSTTSTPAKPKGGAGAKTPATRRSTRTRGRAIEEEEGEDEEE